MISQQNQIPTTDYFFSFLLFLDEK